MRDPASSCFPLRAAGVEQGMGDGSNNSSSGVGGIRYRRHPPTQPHYKPSKTATPPPPCTLPHARSTRPIAPPTYSKSPRSRGLEIEIHDATATTPSALLRPTPDIFSLLHAYTGSRGATRRPNTQPPTSADVESAWTATPSVGLGRDSQLRRGVSRSYSSSA